jgi:hypothetical protein
MIALALLYHFEPQSYYRVFALIGIVPFRYPFLDFQFFLASVDCWQHGIDVYVTNPCDVLGGRFDYPPLWLRFTFLPGKEWTSPLGLCLAISFFLALAVLPPPRSGREQLPRLIATLSPPTMLAVERGNPDLIMFVLATAAGVLLLRPLRGRVAGYAMIVIGGLLKLYPLVLMVLTLRERPRVFLWVNAVAATVVMATGLYFHAEVAKMVRNISPNSDFGAQLLPQAILDSEMHAGPAVLGLMRLATFAALFLAMAGWFFGVVRWRDFRVALSRLPEPEKIFLLIGAALIVGCFFAGPNIIYRGIHLLFTLPGLLAMKRMEDDMRVRRVAVQGCVLVVALTWANFFIWTGVLHRISLVSWIDTVPGVRLVRFFWYNSLWYIIQIAWWQVVTLFIAILIGCCFNWFEADAGSRHRAEVAGVHS